jgi:hypothetical protein
MDSARGRSQRPEPESGSVELVTAIAGGLSAAFAFGALWYARDTVRETRALRREDRLSRLPELIAEFGKTIPTMGQTTFHYTIPRARIEAMLAPLDDPLPNCRLLATGAEFDDSGVFTDSPGVKRIEEVTRAALAEPAELMRARSSKGVTPAP